MSVFPGILLRLQGSSPVSLLVPPVFISVPVLIIKRARIAV